MLRWFRKYHQYLVRINYKSGISQDCWFYNLKFKNDEATWITPTQTIIHLGYDSIESVHVLKVKLGRKMHD